MKRVVVSGSFDDLRSWHIRFLQEASKIGGVTVLLWSDEMINQSTGAPPKFSLPERQYVVNSIRFIERTLVHPKPFDPDILPAKSEQSFDSWVVDPLSASQAKESFCSDNGIEYALLSEFDLTGYPEAETARDPEKKNVVVTGCFDWLHSGHVRFFEEVSEHGNLFVVVGHDANVRLLKGAGHPLLPEDERRYQVQSIRFVTQALISTGNGWMDGEPEIDRIGAHIYAVNDDGDRSEKREFCKERGLEYLVLKREPKKGLAKRTSTGLRGF